jgi:hypothetical protein
MRTVRTGHEPASRLNAANEERNETMSKVLPGPGGGHWSLICSTGQGADVMAHAGSGVADRRRADWHRAIERLRDGDGTLDVRSTGDGHFQWTLVGDDGVVVAESPPVHRDPESCRRAFTAARRAARTAVGP